MNDAEAKRRYIEYTSNNDIVHCNRYPSWDELSKASKKTWKILLDPANRRVNKT